MFRSSFPPRPPLPTFQENAIRRPSGDKDPKSLNPAKLVRGTTDRVGAGRGLPGLTVLIDKASASPALNAVAVIRMPRGIRRGRGEPRALSIACFLYPAAATRGSDRC